VIANGFDATNGVVERTAGWVWHSLQDLNMESNPVLRAHIILLRDETDNQLVMGMEDINRQNSGCDQDFNDVLISIQANPFEAIAKDKIAELVDPGDLDKDGVMNSDDDYPHDPLRALRVTYPNSTGRAQLAFEDMWPMEGDYDMNDLVFAYTLTEVRDAAGKIRDVEGSFQVKARGSAYSHGFGINFPNLVPGDLQSASLWVDDKASKPLVSESGQRSLTLILTEDTKALADKNPGSRTCYSVKFNADLNCPEVKGPTIHFQATFKNALTREELGSAPYNPFIYIVGDRLRETHLADHLPTDKYKPWLFGWQVEGSNPAIGRYFKTKGGLPWGINVTDEWKQPIEKRPVNECYPAFVNWVNTKGAQSADWYKYPVAGCVFPYPPAK
jgi:LruC domain-containing protein